MVKIKSFITIFFIFTLLLSSGCLGFQSNDPSIPEMEMIKDPVIYSYSKDFTKISGVLFKYNKDSEYFGIAFSHETSAPYGGIFFLGNQNNLSSFSAGDKVTLTGFIDDKNIVLWQDSKYYEVTSIEYTK